MTRILFSVLLLIFAGCASNVYTSYPGEGGNATLVIRFSEAMPNVCVTVDGKLVAEDKYTRRVEVKGVPAGVRSVAVVATSDSRAASVDYTGMLELAGGEERVLLLSTPPHSLGFWVYQGFTFIGILAYAAYLAAQN